MKNADYRALILVSTIIAGIIVDPHTGECFPAKHQAMITEAEHDMINSKKIEKFIDKQKLVLFVLLITKIIPIYGQC